TQLTLLKPYRGLNLNLELVLEAKSSITAPGHFHYTWFVTPARNNTVSFWRRLGYTAGPEFVDGNMGPSWAMVKNERPEYVDGHELQCFTGDSWVATAAAGNNVGSHVPAGWIPAAGVASVLLPNEWHAQ